MQKKNMARLLLRAAAYNYFRGHEQKSKREKKKALTELKQASKAAFDAGMTLEEIDMICNAEAGRMGGSNVK